MNMILKYINGIPIREKNKIYIEFHYKDYEKLVCSALKMKLSVAEMVRLMASPCQQCGNDKIIVNLDMMPHSISKQGPILIHKTLKHDTNTDNRRFIIINKNDEC
jgi:hypothetical protein